MGTSTFAVGKGRGVLVRGAFLVVLSVAAGCGGGGGGDDDDDDLPPVVRPMDAGVDAAVLDCGLRALCEGRCVDLLDDGNHCGACASACDRGEACNLGFCDEGCGLGTERCGISCVPTDVEPTDCGGCDVRCGDGEACDEGRCVASCPPGRTDCSGRCVDLAADVRHCGACEAPCASGERCAGRTCAAFAGEDADGDGIADADEGSAAGIDTDRDGTPDWQDGDSDGDGIPDADEAGDDRLETPPLDSDGDRTPDFRDSDADNDGLADRFELVLRSSPRLKDTDGDGDTDPMELFAESDVLDPTDDVGTRGLARYVLPFEGGEVAQAVRGVVGAARVETLFLVETTDAMAGDPIAVVNGNLGSEDFGARLREAAPEVALGLATFRDFPVAPHGEPGDAFFQVLATPAVVTGRLGAMDLVAGGGGDAPSSGLTAVASALAGSPVRPGDRRLLLVTSASPFHRRWDDPAPTADRATWCGDAQADPCSRYVEGDFVGEDDAPSALDDVLAALGAPGVFVVGLAFDESAPDATTDARAALASLSVRSGTSVPCPAGDPWDPDGPDGPGAAEPRCPDVRGDLLPRDGRDLAAAVEAFFDEVSGAVEAVAGAPFQALGGVLVDDPGTLVDEAALGATFEAVSVTDAGPGCPGADARPVDLDDDDVDDVFDDTCAGDVVIFRLLLRNDALPPRCEDQVLDVPVSFQQPDATRAGGARVIVRVPGVRAACPRP